MRTQKAAPSAGEKAKDPWKVRISFWWWQIKRKISLRSNCIVISLLLVANLMGNWFVFYPCPALRWGALGTCIAGVTMLWIQWFMGARHASRMAELSRLYGLRKLSNLVDEFRWDARQGQNHRLDSRLNHFMKDALECIAQTLFPHRSVSLTFLQLRLETKRLELAAWYPGDLPVDEQFCVDLSDPKENAYAKQAIESARTWYLPYVNTDWAIGLATPSQPGRPVQCVLRRQGLWKRSARKNFRSLLVVPCVVHTGSKTWEPYGVLNVEERRRNAFSDSDFFCACIAANKIAQALAIYTAAKTKRK